MKLISRHLRGHWNFLLFLLLTLIPDLLSAQASGNPVIKPKLVGIVFSEVSKTRFYDAFAYSSLFMTMQYQTMMAGIPFELLREEDLLDSENLQRFSALVFPFNEYSTAAHFEAISTALTQAVANQNLSLITSGRFFYYDENRVEHPGRGRLLKQLFKVQPSSVVLQAQGQLMASTNLHPVTRRFEPGAEIIAMRDVTTSVYAGLTPDDVVPLANFVNATNRSVLAYATRTGPRHVHFAGPEAIGNADLVWSALHWCLYDTDIPVALKASRHPSVFLARADMDESMRIRRVDRVGKPVDLLLEEWKRNYNFVSTMYVNLGTNLATQEYTQWEVSGPLYHSYRAKGNEIGSHSYTHPSRTALLTDEQLEFEFNQSIKDLTANLGVPVVGAAIPGNAESLFVTSELDHYLSYLSGRYHNTGSGYPGGFGWLTPDYQMVYFSLNMDPDFTLIQVDRVSADEAEQVWKDQMAALNRNTWQPWFHWLWHDYAPTVGTNAGYNVAMFSNTIAHAHQLGSEFVTQGQMHNRIKALASSTLSASHSALIKVHLVGTNLGAMALSLPAPYAIESVHNHYAYNSNSIFLNEEGGDFLIKPGAGGSSGYTHVSFLPVRSKLIRVRGNGSELNFSFEGEGEVQVELNKQIPNSADWVVSGADSVVHGENLRLTFNSNKVHNVSIVVWGNRPPVADLAQVAGNQNEPIAIQLGAFDPDLDNLAYQIMVPPIHGSLSGTAPNLIYTPTIDFIGKDSLEFQGRDPAGFISRGTLTIEVRKLNTPPIAIPQAISITPGSHVQITPSGTDDLSRELNVSIISAPRHGSLVRTGKTFRYTPYPWFMGEDDFSFKVDDGELESAPATIKITMQPKIPPAAEWNGGATILLNGDLADWTGFSTYPPDQSDYPGTVLLDFLTASMAHNETNLYLAVTTQNNFIRNFGFNIFIDADNNPQTGYRAGTVGAEFLFQSYILYSHTGANPNSWGWAEVGRADFGIAGPVAEFGFPKLWLGPNAGQIAFLFRADNAANGAPDRGDDFPNNQTGNGSGNQYFRYNLSTAPPLRPLSSDADFYTAVDTTIDFGVEMSSQSANPPIFYLLDSPRHGTLSGNPPDFEYQPNSGFVGTDTFTYSVGDGAAMSPAAVVRLHVQPIISITSSNSGGVHLTWHDFGSNWQIESSSDLASWAAHELQTELVEGFRIVTIPNQGGAKFFRLVIL